MQTSNASLGFGQDHFVHMNGASMQTGYTRTVRPLDGADGYESNARFQIRMQQMAADLAAQDGVDRVEYSFERRDGAIVQCEFRVIERRPVAIAIQDQTIVAGGRPTASDRRRRAA